MDEWIEMKMREAQENPQEHADSMIEDWGFKNAFIVFYVCMEYNLECLKCYIALKFTES